MFLIEFFKFYVDMAPRAQFWEQCRHPKGDWVVSGQNCSLCAFNVFV